MTDSELLNLYAANQSDEAFGELVARHIDLVYSAAIRQTQGRSDLAQDVCQLVFTVLAQKAPLLLCHPSLRGWLLVCVRNFSARALRTERRRVAREKVAQAMNETASSAHPEWERVSSVIDEVLCDLSERERETLLLRCFDKLSFGELGRRLGIGEDAARRRFNRILDRVRRALFRRGITSTAAALGGVLSTQVVTAAPAGLGSFVARSALGSVSLQATGIAVALAAVKSYALSTLVIGLVAVGGLFAAGAGIYFNVRLVRAESESSAGAAAIARAEARLNGIKKARSATGTAGRNASQSPNAAASIEEQVARDLELSRWKAEQRIARGIQQFAPFFKARGITIGQVQQMIALARKAYADLDDLREIAQLAGVKVESDPELQSQAQQIVAQYKVAVGAIVGPANAAASDQYAAANGQAEQNGLQSGCAKWVTDQVAGTAFAVGATLTAEQRAQMGAVLLKNTPSYQPGDPSDPTTLNWNGIFSDVQAAGAPAAELAALQSFQAEATTWELKKEATRAAGASR